MSDVVAYIVFGVLLLVQAIERYLYQRDMTNKLNDSIKAIMSRNISEYLAATKPVNRGKEERIEIDDIPLETMNDKDFTEAIKKM